MRFAFDRSAAYAARDETRGDATFPSNVNYVEGKRDDVDGRSAAYESYDLPRSSRSTFEELTDVVCEKISEAPGEVFVLGESMGAGLAIAAADRERPSGVVLVSPATGWDRTALGARREALLALPDLAFTAVLALTAFQILDVDQVATALSRTVSGIWPPLLRTKARQDFLKRVIEALPSKMASPAATVRHRLRNWAEPTLRLRSTANDMLQDTPTLVVAGTRDARVPAAEEAQFFYQARPTLTTVHLVQGAGHAGVLDERVDLTAIMRDWRAGA